MRRLSILPVIALVVSMAAPACADSAVGTGSGRTLLDCQYNSTLPGLSSGQTGVAQCDSLNRLIISPMSLLFSAPLQTYGAQGVGASTAFPGSVSTSGTSLGSLPTGASQVRLLIPIGASVTGYAASSVAGSAGAAALVASTYSNASGATNVLVVDIPLNGMQFWVTNYTSGSSTTYTSGSPVYRFI